MKLLLSEEGRNSETCYSDINCVDFDFSLTLLLIESYQNRVNFIYANDVTSCNIDTAVVTDTVPFYVYFVREKYK